MKAFILAGGFATRLWPLTERRSKPLLPLAGKTLIDHLIDNINNSAISLPSLPAEASAKAGGERPTCPARSRGSEGFNDHGIPITISINAAFQESFERWKAQSNHPRVEILVEQSQKDAEKLGALGAVAQWIERHSIDEDVLLLTGDNYCGFSIPDFLRLYPGTPLLAAHDIGDPARARGFGSIIPASDGQRVAAFEEKPVHPKSSLVSTGISLLPAAHLRTVTEYARKRPDNVGGVFEEFLRRSIPVEFRAYTAPWFDIGSFEAYLEATRALVGDRVLLGHGSSCTGTKTEGSVVLGNHSVVRNSTLRNVILFDHCTVEDCVLSDCIIDDHCTLQGIDLSGQMLREGTILKTKD